MVIIISLTWMKDSCRLMNSMKSLNQQLFEAILNIVIWEEIFDRNSRIVNQIILWFIAIAICSDDRMSTASIEACLLPITLLREVWFQSTKYTQYNWPARWKEKRKKKKQINLFPPLFTPSSIFPFQLFCDFWLTKVPKSKINTWFSSMILRLLPHIIYSGRAVYQSQR